MTGDLPVPQGWGGDSLSAFLDAALTNTFATFQQAPAWYQRVSAVDRNFHTLVGGLDNNTEPLGAVFVLRAHAAYLAAARVGLSVQIPETYMLIRGCLEAAAYGLYLARHSDARELWIKRQDSKVDRDACRKKLTARTIHDYLKFVDPDTHGRYERLYEWSIDLGAHPNAWSIAGHLQMSESDNAHSFELHYLGGTPLEIHASLKDVVTAGVISLDVFRLLFRERFDLLGITERLAQLKLQL